MNKVYIMVGVPGSGKSTYAEKLSKETGAVIISSDNIREELYGDAAIQGDNGKVFGMYYYRAKCLLLEGKDIILDATNLTKKDRKNIYNRFGNSYHYEAFVCAVPKEVAKERNANRERVVPEEVIDRMYDRFTFPYEDWIKIVTVLREGT